MMIRAIALAAVLSASQAAAHDWYDLECCDAEDCAPVAAHVISATSEGWLVEVEPGEHPFATRRIQLVIPYGHRKERQSQDADFHLCLGRSGNVYCIYVPVFGS